jgi:hypothetical protein
MAEAFVKIFKRDCVRLAIVRDCPISPAACPV